MLCSETLLSIVVNLSPSANGTQSAPQAASQLVHHGGTQLLDSTTTTTHGERFEAADKHAESHSFFDQSRAQRPPIQLFHADLPPAQIFQQSLQLSTRVPLSYTHRQY